jgi:SAM-dependent methyltransferase
MTEDTSRKAHWEGVYAQKEPTGVSWYEAVPAASLALLEAAGAGVEDPLVDVGGGASTLVDHLLARGHRRLTVLDLAGGALARAQERLGGEAARVEWVAADVLDWRPEPHAFRFWHDRAVFHFLTDEATRAAYVATVRHALAPGGQLVLATFAPDGPERCSGLPVARHDAASLAAALGAPFSLEEERREEHLTPGGNVQRFVFTRFLRR